MQQAQTPNQNKPEASDSAFRQNFWMISQRRYARISRPILISAPNSAAFRSNQSEVCEADLKGPRKILSEIRSFLTCKESLLVGALMVEPLAIGIVQNLLPSEHIALPFILGVVFGVTWTISVILVLLWAFWPLRPVISIALKVNSQ